MLTMRLLTCVTCVTCVTWILMVRPSLSLPAQQTEDYHYWWLGLASPFGGRNYNIEQIQRGEHISNSSRSRQLTKRQSEDSVEKIKLNEIDTECPRLSHCVPPFFCDRFRGETRLDQIPCLLTSGQFSGTFGICCQREFPRKCPIVAVPPPPRQCLPRPLGDPEDDECALPGERGRCPGPDSLCCFNGCLNVCLPDPPYSVQKSVFIRRKAFIVSQQQPGDYDELSPVSPPEFEPNDDDDDTDYSGDGDYDEDDYSSDGDDYLDFINPRRPPRSRLLRNSQTSASPLKVEHIFQRLLQKLRNKIS